VRRYALRSRLKISTDASRFIAFSSEVDSGSRKEEVDSGSRKENASKKESKARL
jgi:hypothetical protein